MKNSNPESEAEYIRRILQGEKDLFHDLIRPCERGIYFLLLSLLKNETEAEDAAQEAVIKVYLNLSADGQVECPYCSRLFIHQSKRGHGAPLM